MKKEKKYIEYILKQAEALLAIDSPSGFTEKVTDYLCEEYKRLGYKPVKTKKGGVLVEIGGKGNAILTMAHVDTLGDQEQRSSPPDQGRRLEREQHRD